MSTTTTAHTGVADIDALIDAFLSEPLGDWTNDDRTISALADGSEAHGACQDVSWQFAEFARARGFKAYETNTDLEELGYTIQPGSIGGEIGFNEDGEMQYGHYPEHTVVTLCPPGEWPNARWSEDQYGEFFVDFTASQYGYAEHPKVTT